VIVGKLEPFLSPKTKGHRVQVQMTSPVETQGNPLQPASFYRPELDVLRFFAFFAVFINHTSSPSVSFYTARHFPRAIAEVLASTSRAGGFGVDLFFLLSAYLITSLLLRERAATGTISLRNFYIRRCLRIWPLYFFALFVAALWPIAQWRMSPHYVVGYSLFMGNWMSAYYGSPASFMAILWSVSVEEQFYMSWPIVPKWANQRGIVMIALILIAVAWGVRFHIERQMINESWVWHNTFVHLDPIAFGILIAVILKANILYLKAGLRTLLLAIGLGIIVTVGHFSQTSADFVLFGYPAAAIGCVAVFFAVAGADISKRIWNRKLVHLGKISYGLYVYHSLSLYLSSLLYHGRTSRPFWFGMYWLTALLLTIVLAHFSYKWMETPFLQMKNRFTIVRSRTV
jgi:peptidoglycan/LPS O-acetylase OafA/YrhL